MARHNLALVESVPSGSAKVDALAGKYKAVSADLARLEAAKKEIATKLLKATLNEAEPDAEGKLRLETDRHKLVVVDGESAAQLSATELLRLGVRPSIIKKATIAGTKYRYVRVDVKKPSASAK